MSHGTTRLPVFSPVFVLLLMGVGAASAGTVGYWRLDNDGAPAGGTAGTVTDETGAHDGLGHLAPTYSDDVFGGTVPRTNEGNLLSIDLEKTAEQAIVVPHGPALSFGASPFTIEAWVRLESLGSISSGGRSYLLQKKGSAGMDKSADYTFMVQSGNRVNQAIPGLGKTGGFTGRELCSAWGDGSDQFFLISNLEIDDTEWHFASMAFDGSDTIRFTLDDQSESIGGLAALGHVTNAGELVIGARTTGGGSITDTFDGRIDEIRISDVFLAETELLNASPAVATPLSVVAEQRGAAAFPNPFTTSTSWSYSVPSGPGEQVDVAVYDLRGRRVRQLATGFRHPGAYHVSWDGRTSAGKRIPSGAYFVRAMIGARGSVFRVVAIR